MIVWVVNLDDVYKFDLFENESVGIRVGGDVVGYVFEVGICVIKVLKKGDCIVVFVFL